MEQAENICRICRQESDHMESLYSVREGLPLSVIMMIICPIKILKKDSLPKLICMECLEVVLSAYKLREESIESDRYFKNFNEAVEVSEEVIGEQPTTRIKHEEFVETTPVYEISPATSKTDLPRIWPSTSSSLNILSKIKTKEQFTKEVDFPYKVECLKKTPKSFAWNNFGQLVDKFGEIVESEKNFLFCKLCVAEKNSIQNRYKNTISTGWIHRHLQTVHGISKEEIMVDTADEDEDSDFESTPKKKKSSTPGIIGLTFECPEENCEQVFKLKVCLEIHLGLEHTGIADAEPASTEYQVDISNKKSKTMAWKYFGPLLDYELNLIDDEHNYCRLCAGDGKLYKYVSTVSTATLLQHLRRKHMNVGRKRKRFERHFAEDENLAY